MDVFRFDEGVSIPEGRFGSAFRRVPLVGPGEVAGGLVAYLEPGGRIGRHPAVSAQLFAVVAGAGWASGADGVRREVAAGQAVRWQPGEEHEVGTDVGLTALVLEGSLPVWAAAVTGDLVVSEYDPAWPHWFAQVHDRVWPAVRDVALRIDHVGSTSVPGLAAKPIIDLDVVVAAEDDVPAAIERLRQAGYRWRGDLGIEGRQAFAPPADEDLPRHHLYLVVDGNRAHLDHVLLRDLLREDAAARDRYAALKRANAERAGGDLHDYLAAKAALVAELLTRARAERGLPPVEYWRPE